jgi:hypothetical protein
MAPPPRKPVAVLRSDSPWTQVLSKKDKKKYQALLGVGKAAKEVDVVKETVTSAAVATIAQQTAVLVDLPSPAVLGLEPGLPSELESADSPAAEVVPHSPPSPLPHPGLMLFDLSPVAC